MNTLILEWNKFIRSKLFFVILGVLLILFGSLFYKNYLDFQQVDADKKHELLKIRVEIENILYPSDKNKVCIYSDDKEKMKLLNEALKITEKTLKDKHSGNEKAFMEDAVSMYEKIIEMHENKIDFQFSKSYSEYEKERLTEILKIKGNFQYEQAPLDGILLIHNNIKYLLLGTFLVIVFYFFITSYLDFNNHKGFLFTLPINRNNFVISKAVISLLINIILIFVQLIVTLGFGNFLKWKSNFRYPVFFDMFGKFIPVSKAVCYYILIQILLSFIVLFISVCVLRIYTNSKNKK